MANSSTYPGAGDEAGVGPSRGSSTGTPHWVKVFGIAALVLVLLVVVLIVAGDGRHGPGRHTGSYDGSGGRAPAAVMDDRTPLGGDLGGHRPPEGGHRSP
jgi:hypothetical protein